MVAFHSWNTLLYTSYSVGSSTPTKAATDTNRRNLHKERTACRLQNSHSLHVPIKKCCSHSIDEHIAALHICVVHQHYCFTHHSCLIQPPFPPPSWHLPHLLYSECTNDEPTTRPHQCALWVGRGGAVMEGVRVERGAGQEQRVNQGCYWRSYTNSAGLPVCSRYAN